MNRLVIALALPALLGAGSAAAVEQTTAVSYIDQSNVIERFRYLERVDVTAEKPMVDPALAEELSPELEAILDEAAALEDAGR